LASKKDSKDNEYYWGKAFEEVGNDAGIAGEVLDGTFKDMNLDANAWALNVKNKNDEANTAQNGYKKKVDETTKEVGIDLGTQETGYKNLKTAMDNVVGSSKKLKAAVQKLIGKLGLEYKKISDNIRAYGD
jgi:hypothetical protein